MDVDWGDGDLEAGTEAEQKAAGVQLPHLKQIVITSSANITQYNTVLCGTVETG